MANLTTALQYEGRPKAPIRLLVSLAGEWRAVAWLDVGKDGSIYFGPRRTNVTDLRLGTMPLKGTQSTFKYGEGQPVTDTSALENAAKLSFHASGRVHAGGSLTLRNSFRSITVQDLVCVVAFEYPTAFEAIAVPRKRDIALDYPINRGRPMSGQLYVAPLGTEQIVYIPSATYQTNLLIHYRNLRDVPDLAVQLVLSHGVVGHWPRETVVVWRGNADSDQSKTVTPGAGA